MSQKIDAQSINQAKDNYSRAVSFKTPSMKRKVKSEDKGLFKLPKFQRLIPEEQADIKPDTLLPIVKELDIRVADLYNTIE